MLGFGKRAAPPDAVWVPAKLWNVANAGKGGVHAVILLNDDVDAPDLALTGGVWTTAQANLAATNGFAVSERRGKLTAKLADGTLKSVIRPQPRMQWLADERFAKVRESGFGSSPASGG